MAFPKEFAAAMERACRQEIPLDEVELATMGFTHCETGQALAEKWHLADDIVEVIASPSCLEQSIRRSRLSPWCT